MQLQKKAVYNQLLRPVHISEADINSDGKNDFVVCEFGYLIGALSWLQNNGNSTYTRHVVRDVENKSNLTFQPYSLPATKQGRWINMDVADVDGDHQPDILLANCSVEPTINYSAYNWKLGPSFMVLKNTGRKSK